MLAWITWNSSMVDLPTVVEGRRHKGVCYAHVLLKLGT